MPRKRLSSTAGHFFVAVLPVVQNTLCSTRYWIWVFRCPQDVRVVHAILLLRFLPEAQKRGDAGAPPVATPLALVQAGIEPACTNSAYRRLPLAGLGDMTSPPAPNHAQTSSQFERDQAYAAVDLHQGFALGDAQPSRGLDAVNPSRFNRAKLPSV